MTQPSELTILDQQQASDERDDLPDWAVAEYQRNQREHDAVMRRVERDAEWLRLWEAEVLP